MEAARNFVAKHTATRGHTTKVEEVVRPAVTWETVLPHRHEIVTTALDKEVHQHHYHTTVQPLAHSVTVPTKHVHNLIPIKETTHQKDDVEATKRRVLADAALFRNQTVTLPTVVTTKQMPMVIGTHYHHHVHEIVQPVIHKEVLTSEIVHTTLPIHERHHMKAEHHGISALPFTTMTEFATLKASPRAAQQYEGAPRPYEASLATTFDKLALLTPSKSTSTPLNHKNLAITTPTHRRRSSSNSSASSASSLSSMDAPMTPRSPGRHSKTIGNFNPTAINTVPAKDVNANQPLQIVDHESPRMSHESTGSNHRGFMSRLTGRA